MILYNDIRQWDKNEILQNVEERLYNNQRNGKHWQYENLKIFSLEISK